MGAAMSTNIISFAQFDSLAAGASQDATRKMAEVASATSAAIKELAEQVFQTDGSINIAASMEEPNDNLYWLYIEDTEEEIHASSDITITESNVEPAVNSYYWFYIEDTEDE